MSTSTNYKIATRKSKIIPALFFAIVIDPQKTRLIYVTGMFESRHWATNAAKDWTENSQSKAAKTLRRAGG